MSAPLAGKFQDHYEVLGVDPKATREDIDGIYTELIEQYQPDNPETGDQEKFDAVNLAYEILSDPVLRKEFDKIKGIGAEVNTPKFSGLDFFVALGREAAMRFAVLCILYDRRRADPLRPGLTMRQVEAMLNATGDELIFALWYLKQRRLATLDDKSSLEITVDGMDFLESNRPSPEIVMPLIKASALATSKFPPKAVLHVAAAPAAALALEIAGTEDDFVAAIELPEDFAPIELNSERAVPPEAGSGLKALRSALAGTANRITASR